MQKKIQHHSLRKMNLSTPLTFNFTHRKDHTLQMKIEKEEKCKAFGLIYSHPKPLHSGKNYYCVKMLWVKVKPMGYQINLQFG